ncbi:MAG: PIG-L family deacetylase [Endozoicomonas sp.]
MKNKQSPSRNVRRALVIFVLAAGVLSFLYSSLWAWVIILLAAYIAHEVLLADHIHYSPDEDYSWQFSEGDRRSAEIHDNKLAVPEDWKHDYSVFLKIKVKASLLGKIYDPLVRLVAGSSSFEQYFERSCAGFRYINLTPSIEASGNSDSISLNSKYCSLEAESAELLAFEKPDLTNKKVLFIAPHSDDLEIAAFGLYRNTDCMLITITAGEAEPETFSRYQKSTADAALLKGRVRAWDSIAIPQWAGVQTDRVIQLGYFCMHLKDMHDSPEEAFKSRYADTSDIRLFREFNSIKLSSDADGQASWEHLVNDLSEIMQWFQPDTIVTPHPEADSHPDHFYSTLAIKEAAKKLEKDDIQTLFYINHLDATDQFPFGPAKTLASIPPVTVEEVNIAGAFSFSLSEEEQRDKLIALQMNHDLRRPVRPRKWLRKQLQKLLINRYKPDYGNDEFFRKAVRANELFILDSSKSSTEI